MLPASLRSVYALADTLAYFCPSLLNRLCGVSLVLANSRLIPDSLANRYAGDDRRYRDEMRLHADLGFNIIRVWGGSMTERPAFYDAADELGVFVWQEVRMRRHRNAYLITQPRLVHHSYIYFLKDFRGPTFTIGVDFAIPKAAINSCHFFGPSLHAVLDDRRQQWPVGWKLFVAG